MMQFFIGMAVAVVIAALGAWRLSITPGSVFWLCVFLYGPLLWAFAFIFAADWWVHRRRDA